MKYISKILLLSAIGFSIAACQAPPTTPTDGRNIRTDEEYEEIKRLNEDREEIIREARERARKKNEETCDELDKKEQKDCQEMCKNMYAWRRDRIECEKLELVLIEDLYEVYKKLKDADDLELVDPSLFNTYLNHGISGLEKIISDYSENEAEDFLVWLIDYPDIADIFREEDKDHEMFESLLKSFHKAYSRNTIYNTFTRKLEGDKLMEIAINSINENLVKWFMNFIDEKNSSCDDDPDTKACFEVYCKIGNDLDEEVRDDWLEDYKEFEEYIEDIIDEKVNSRNADSSDSEKYNETGWRYGRRDIEDLSDFNNDWVAELCHGLR